MSDYLRYSGRDIVINQQFTPNELEFFRLRFERNPAWSACSRETVGTRDVLSFVIGGDSQRRVRIAKTGPADFAVRGLDDWGLVVAHRLSDVLDLISRIDARPLRTAA